MEHEVNGLDYRYVYSDKARLSVVVQGIEHGSASLLDDKGELHAYYHTDYLGTTDYLTSAVNSKIISWTSYSEWGEITHNAVLKCGQRELDLVKEYATHDFDAVLNMYYAKARFYDADNRRFVAVDPILDASQYDLTAYTRTPVIYDQYIYVKNGPLIYIDEDGEIFALVTGLVGAAAGAAVGAYKSYKDTGKVSLKSTLVGAAVGAAVGVGAGALAGAALAGSATASTAAVASGAAKVATAAAATVKTATAAAATSVKSAAAAAATSVKTTAAAAAAKVGSAATAVATVANQIGEKVVQAAQQVGTQINNVTTQIAARLVTQPGVVGTVAQNSLTNPDVAVGTVASGANVLGGFKTAYDYAVEGDYKNAGLTLLSTAPTAFMCYAGCKALSSSASTVSDAESVTGSLQRPSGTDSEPVNIELRYKPEWTPEQRAEADAKVAALTAARTVKTNPDRGTTSASYMYKSVYGKDSVLPGQDVDHIIDLQLGGANDILNMRPLDSSVNRSLGSQISHLIKGYPEGTVFGTFTIK